VLRIPTPLRKEALSARELPLDPIKAYSVPSPKDHSARGADTRLFILTYVKQHPIQEVQGQLFGMSQSNANTWIHLWHPVLNRALADQERLPARTAPELAAMFFGSLFEVL
jgi:Helix-turn-helix of DDE superfamily endonuclease